MTAQQLRKSILQLAVQGKLVPQDSKDEPANLFLERILAEKAFFDPSAILCGNDPDVPFKIPDTWAWVRVRTLGKIVCGSGIKKSETVSSGKPCVRYGELYTTYHTSFRTAVSFIPDSLDKKCRHISYGDILMTLTGENKPDIAKSVAFLGNGQIAAGRDLACWSSHGMNPLFLSYLMSAPYVIGRKVELATGNAIVHISVDRLGTILIPIPPLAEQQRIVDRMIVVEKMLSEYTQKADALSTLNRSFPLDFQKSVLQWAVHGKLVSQDPAEESASALLAHIREEKRRLIKAHIIRPDKRTSIIFRRDNSHYEKLDLLEWHIRFLPINNIIYKRLLFGTCFT